MGKICCFVILCFLRVGFYSQDQNLLDSLKQELKLATHDTAKIQLRSTIGFEGWILREGYWDSISNDCKKHLLSSEKLTSRENFVYKEQLGTALMSVAYIKSNNGEVDKAYALYEETLELKKDIDDKDGIATIYNNMANIFDDRGDIPKALELYENSLAIREEIGDKSGIASTLNNLAYLYTELKEYDMAIDYFSKSLAMSKEQDAERSVGLALNNLGYVYHLLGDYNLAEKYHKESLEIRLKINDLRGIAMSNNNLGKVAKEMKKFEEALDFFEVSLQIYTENNAKKGIGTTLSNMGETYMEMGNYTEADKCIQQSLDIANELGFPLDIQIAAKMLMDISSFNGDYKKAFEMHKLYMLMRDSLTNIENNKLIIKQSLQYEYEKKSLADSVLASEEKKVTDAKISMQKAKIEEEQTKKYALFGGLALMFLFGGFMYNRFRITRKQKNIIETQKTEVEKQKVIAEHQKELVQEKNKEILDSINYAKRIQSAILPPKKVIEESLKDYFIFYKPKDIVAGDFYWLEKKSNKILFAVADCTGHGVPGAMVSVVCNNGLNRSVREHGLTEPGDILDRTREIVIAEFSKSEEDVVDGMDISLCALEGNVLRWAGANNPLWIVRENNLIEVAPNKQPIGKYQFPEPFNTHEIELQKNDVIYIFSDGFQDQFGGPKKKKYKVKNLKSLLVEASKNPMKKQFEILESAFEDWRGDFEQIDDICILGMRF